MTLGSPKEVQDPKKRLKTEKDDEGEGEKDLSHHFPATPLGQGQVAYNNMGAPENVNTPSGDTTESIEVTVKDGATVREQKIRMLQLIHRFKIAVGQQRSEGDPGSEQRVLNQSWTRTT